LTFTAVGVKSCKMKESKPVSENSHTYYIPGERGIRIRALAEERNLPISRVLAAAVDLYCEAFEDPERRRYVATLAGWDGISVDEFLQRAFDLGIKNMISEKLGEIRENFGSNRINRE